MSEQALKDIRTHYPDEYLLVEVTREEDGQPVEGILRAHGKDRKRILGKMHRYVTSPVYFFFNGLEVKPETAYVLSFDGGAFDSTGCI